MNSLTPEVDNSSEPVDIHQHTVQIIVNGKTFTVAADESGEQIKAAVKAPADFQLYRIVGHKEELIGNDQEVRVHEHERFLVAPTLDPSLISNPAHEIAVASVRQAFPELTVEAVDIGGGVTSVILHDADIGRGWTESAINLETRLQPTFPSTPPYPFYGPEGLAATDARQVPVSRVLLDGAPRAQISLNKPFDPTVETLGARLAAVLAWLRGGK